MSLDIQNIAVNINGFDVSCDSLCIEPSKIVGLIGPSGSGKTTMLHILLGLHNIVQGTIMYNEQDITHTPMEQRPVSMVFQDNNLFEHLSVRDNVYLGFAANVNNHDRDKIFDIIIGMMHLQEYIERFPHHLSGGQRSRVALARALVMDRPIILLDEPFAALDPGLRYDLLHDIKHIAIKQQKIVILSSHDPLMIQDYCDYFAFMYEGQLLSYGKPEDVLHSGPVIHQYLYGHYHAHNN